MSKEVTQQGIAKIIVSDIGIPSNRMGSWTQLVEYLLGTYKQNDIQYLLSATTPIAFQSAVTQRIICKIINWEITKRWFYPIKYRSFVKALEHIISSHPYAVIAIMDHIKLKNIVSDTIAKNGWEHKCRVIFVQCAYSYELQNEDYKYFKRGLQEVVLLTHKSYLYELHGYNEYPFLAHVLHNPIRQDIFFKLSDTAKLATRHSIGIDADANMFLWVSHDRPKKGLDIILRMWPQVYAKHPNAQLVIVGATRTITLPGLRFMGKMPNADIAKYYQAADVYLFSSICQEGFGLSLAEAMSCGCYCIASDVGGVSEFFDAKNGILLQSPNLTEAWVEAIEQYFNLQKEALEMIPTPFLSYDEWCRQFLKIMDDSASFLEQSTKK